jgi:hypothetical protein
MTAIAARPMDVWILQGIPTIKSRRTWAIAWITTIWQ